MAKEENLGKSLQEIGDLVGFTHSQSHLFICTGPDCASAEAGMAAWNVVKKTVKQLCPNLKAASMFRTKVGCLRICKQGPIAVSYPQGIWFHSVTEDNAADVVDFLHKGAQGTHPLEFARHPLPPAPAQHE